MENRELTHWGIKDMKWGVRRYQNKDGTLTELGKKRYYREADNAGYKNESGTGARYKTTKKGKKQRFDADPDEWVKKDRERTKRLTEETGQMTGKLKNIVDKSIKNNKRETMDLSNMTDKEMRDRINRTMLERQYNDMFAPQKSTRGREFVSNALEVGGDVLAVGSTALGIALAIQALRTGK
jgi:hypothetical protein